MSSPSERNEAPEPLTGQPVGTTRQHVSLFARSADLPRGKRRIQGIRRVRAARHLSQLLFAALILGASVRHQLAVRSGTTPSTDALCPFGGVETLVTWITTGNFISKTHISNLILFAAVVVATVLVGNAFCGWVCPFGALQDALSWLRRTLHLPTFEPPHRVDRVLRWGRFVTLGVILYFSISTAKLWFAGWDPCVNLFGLGWLFGDGEKMPLALSVIGGDGRRVVARRACLVPLPVSVRCGVQGAGCPVAHPDPPLDERVHRLRVVRSGLPGQHHPQQGLAHGLHRLRRLPGLCGDLSGEWCPHSQRAGAAGIAGHTRQCTAGHAR